MVIALEVFNSPHLWLQMMPVQEQPLQDKVEINRAVMWNVVAVTLGSKVITARAQEIMRATGATRTRIRTNSKVISQLLRSTFRTFKAWDFNRDTGRGLRLGLSLSLPNRD